MKAILFAIVLTLSACGKMCWMEPDQKERQRIFKECMRALPAGPVSTHYNDWSEVVSECESAAYYQSHVKRCSGE
jgi:hypothetical protein